MFGAVEVNPTLVRLALHPFRCYIQIYRELFPPTHATQVLFIWQEWWPDCRRLLVFGSLQPAEFMFGCLLKYTHCKGLPKCCMPKPLITVGATEALLYETLLRVSILHLQTIGQEYVTTEEPSNNVACRYFLIMQPCTVNICNCRWTTATCCLLELTGVFFRQCKH